MINSIGISSQFYTDVETTDDIKSNLSSFFNNETLPALKESQTNISLIVHSPYSLPHLSRLDETNKDLLLIVKDRNGKTIHTDDTGETVGIPPTKEVLGDELTEIINRYSQELGVKVALPSTQNVLYGDFQPRQIFNLNPPVGIGLDPHKFVLAFMLKAARDKKSSGTSLDLNLVFHTDILFFMSHCGLKDFKAELENISMLAQTLGLKVYFENNEYSNNNVYNKAMYWTHDPMDISRTIGTNNNLGVCMDIKHCLRNGMNVQEVENTFRSLKNSQPNVIIHTRKRLSDMKEVNQLMTEIYKTGTLVAYEG